MESFVVRSVCFIFRLASALLSLSVKIKITDMFGHQTIVACLSRLQFLSSTHVICSLLRLMHQSASTHLLVSFDVHLPSLALPNTVSLRSTTFLEYQQNALIASVDCSTLHHLSLSMSQARRLKRPALDVFRDDDVAPDGSEPIRIDVPQSRSIEISSDGQRLITTPRSPMKHVRSRIVYPAGELLPGWDTFGEFDNFGGDDEGDEDSEVQDIVLKVTAKRYPGSDAPLREWTGYGINSGYREEYLLEDLRRDGRGDARHLVVCPTCNATESDGDIPRFRCEECSGGLIECRMCCLHRHQRLPLHMITWWNDHFFERKRLQQLGLRVQLGHMDMHCINPKPGHQDFIVIHTNGIHHVSVDFCDCHENHVSHRQQLLRYDWFPATVAYPQTCCTVALLQHFHIMTLASKISGHEFYNSLERLTDNTGLSVPKTRYKSFMRSIRQFRHLKLLKRAGRGNEQDGIATTKRGGLALLCPACPDPNRNLPSWWQDAEPALAFLYAAIYALDANFRLKNRLRSSEQADPGLHTGKAYFVEDAPYHEHVLKYATQEDISTCSGFKTLAHAESKFSAGMRCTGVAACICARHEILRPLGVGDLQKGERYCNVDYIFLSAVTPVLVLYLIASYDIACQWRINLPSRLEAMPEHLKLSEDVLDKMKYGVPKFHGPAHDMKCQIPYSLNVMPGVGRTDGEGIERNWSNVNPVASSTQEMGPGSRHDTLDDHFHHHNFRKYVTIGDTLRKKLLLAIPEWNRQRAAHEEFTLSLPDPALATVWTNMIQAWDEDHDRPNPYTIERSTLTEADVKRQLVDEERTAELNGQPRLDDTSPSSFVSMGMMLEELQAQITVEAVNESTLTANQLSLLNDRRHSLRKHIARFRPLQTVYMPGVALKISADSRTTTEEPPTEEIKLWLPSSLTKVERENMCHPDLEGIEGRLREAQCMDALDRLRAQLRAKIHFMKHKNANVRNQRRTTRAVGIIARFTVRINAISAKYCRGRTALLGLVGSGAWEGRLKPLLPQDIRLPGEGEGGFTIEDLTDPVGAAGRIVSKKRLVERAERKRLLEEARGLGEGYRLISWIWLSGVGIDDSTETQELNAALRMEWAKGRARAERWGEEVMLLKEEMRRVQVSLAWQAEWWEERRAGWDGLEAGTEEGISAYARKQATIQRSLRTRFMAMWAAPLAEDLTTQEPDEVVPSGAAGEGPDEDADAAADEDDEHW